MKHRLTLLLLLILFLFSLFFCFAELKLHDFKYIKREIKQKKLNLKSINLTNCDIASEVSKLIYILSCQNKSKDIDEDYGQRLHLIDLSTDKPKILFEESGAMDAYSYHLSFFSLPKVNNRLIVFAETGTEYSWGTDVYFLESKEMRWIGNVDAMLVNRPNSAIKNVVIEKNKNSIVFKFSTDVEIPINEGSESYLKIPKNEIKYVYQNKKLKRVLSSRMNQVLKTRK